MAIRITCIRTAKGQHEIPLTGIESMSWIEDGTNLTGKSTRTQMYDLVRQGLHVYLRDIHGNVVNLSIAETPSGTPYLKTATDITNTDKLLKLPSCR